jgi:hypothetical protein
MLDVHPPHTSVHTWKDFFIHITTIVIGLLIAIGLEQTVEYVHHRREVAETREGLRQEREENRKFFAVNTLEFRLEAAALQNNLRVLIFLQRHPAIPEEKLPGVLSWGSSYEAVVETVWKNAQQTQVLALMPRPEAESDATLYRDLESAEAEERKIYEAVTLATTYGITDPNPTHLPPQQVAQEIDLTTAAIRANFRWGIALRNLHRDYPDFAPAPIPDEILHTYRFDRTPADNARLARAKAITDADLDPIRAARNAALTAAGDNP